MAPVPPAPHTRGRDVLVRAPFHFNTPFQTTPAAPQPKRTPPIIPIRPPCLRIRRIPNLLTTIEIRDSRLISILANLPSYTLAFGDGHAPDLSMRLALGQHPKQIHGLSDDSIHNLDTSLVPKRRNANVHGYAITSMGIDARPFSFRHDFWLHWYQSASIHVPDAVRQRGAERYVYITTVHSSRRLTCRRRLPAVDGAMVTPAAVVAMVSPTRPPQSGSMYSTVVVRSSFFMGFLKHEIHLWFQAFTSDPELQHVL
ncbi:uncharacterized protein MYCFIDRAFT_173479 [Pseudocercospora fijiensis CIRAD86]|uniref:Uncharacterized protein n=1 Tax=Pseudocercospora fijiensis (strain CIRAD86) TaxID=383855 RepID=M2Z3V8_PSEFD|nr:uncharacterized protein MYCFIDRAFT_173479 [Pseudocercospora fijiensis CIRAD86]EME84500.1 hypothetical protein MYCFIDRAFT_173479 [Pseudocercospora fijiensis CIRAD86]